MNYSVFDMETDGLIETVTKIHCVCITKFHDGLVGKFTLTDPEEIKNFFLTEEIIVGHNIIKFDIPVIEKLLGIKITARAIDSLGLSQYLYPERQKHGLEFWGIDLGIEKPPISDWSNLAVEDYIYRCEEDVKINIELFNMEIEYLKKIYDNNSDDINRLINYLMFKLQCAREQEEMKWKLDVDKCQENLQFLQSELQTKMETVSDLMPLVVKYKEVVRPKILYKKDRRFSVAGTNWLKLLSEKGLPEYHLGTIKVEISREKGNPGSHQQVKEWLFSLGWIPDEYRYDKDKKTGAVRKIPQINIDGELCDSVKLIIEKIPGLEALEGLYILRHRIGILEGFLVNRDKYDFLKAETQGFTNTLRFKHTIIVNLPQIPSLYWEYIRGCLIAPDSDHVLCGSDMQSLENNTKLHYMMYYDPLYVKEILTEDFDSHLDIAVLAGMLTSEQSDQHKLYDKTKGKEGVSHKAVRLKAKKVNFGGIYGAGPLKLSLTGGFSLDEAKALHKIYWKRNWSVKRIAQDCVVKTIGSQMWLFNPVAQFWYSLRNDKDRFSTLNQGTGVYCFDMWVKNVRNKGIRICGQFHDEIIFPVRRGSEEQNALKLREAEKEVNDQLQLNVPLSISIDFGDNYAQIH